MTLTVAVVHWFQRTRARAMGYLMTGLAIGSFLAPLISFLIDGVGWRATSIGSGILLFVVGQLIATWIVRPSERGLSPEAMRSATVARRRNWQHRFESDATSPPARQCEPARSGRCPLRTDRHCSWSRQ